MLIRIAFLWCENIRYLAIWNFSIITWIMFCLFLNVVGLYKVSSMVSSPALLVCDNWIDSQKSGGVHRYKFACRTGILFALLYCFYSFILMQRLKMLCFRLLNDDVTKLVYNTISVAFCSRANSMLHFCCTHLFPCELQWVLPWGCLYSRGGGLWLVIAIGLSGIDDGAAGKQNDKKEGCQDCSQ